MYCNNVDPLLMVVICSGLFELGVPWLYSVVARRAGLAVVGSRVFLLIGLKPCLDFVWVVLISSRVVVDLVCECMYC